MIQRRIAVLAIPVLALLAACQRLTEQTQRPVARASASESPSEAAAFRAAWGSAPPVTYRAPDAGPGDQAVTYVKARLVPLGGERFALVSEGQGEAGHASAGTLAIHYLSRTPAGLSRIGAWPNMVDGGAFGVPPQWLIRTDLTPAPALVTEAGGTWQGYSCSWSDVIELTPDGPIVRADGIPVGYSSGGAGEDAGEEMDGALSPDIKGRSFSVRYSGDRSAIVRYALRGQRYEATTSPDLLTC